MKPVKVTKLHAAIILVALVTTFYLFEHMMSEVLIINFVCNPDSHCAVKNQHSYMKFQKALSHSALWDWVIKI